MATSNKSKSSNYVIGKLRPSQLIATFGPGAVVDLPDDSVMVAGIDTWKSGPIIHEIRLQQALQVEHFRTPSTKRWDGDIPAKRFPRRRVCSNPSCGLIHYRKKCPECDSATYPARIILICEKGHAEDFLWEWWVHRGNRCSSKLRLKNTGRTAALSDLEVHCDTCNRKQSLSGALGPLGENLKCNGKQPWLTGSPEIPCDAEPRAVLRGASNVYFSSILSALSIPPWSNPIHEVLNDHWETLRHLPEETLPAVIQSLPGLKNLDADAVMTAVRERKANTVTTRSLREEEYLAFSNPKHGKIGNTDFEVVAGKVPEPFINYFEQVVLAFRLREIRVLQGFTRVNPPDPEDPFQEIAPIYGQKQNWLPAVENRGEGIFIRLDRVRLNAWESRKEVRQRVEGLNDAYVRWRHQRGLHPIDRLPLPRLYLLHTFAHLLIRQLSLDCGYSSSSLRERIYSGDDMCGLLIYTASPDSDGSLGGLVQQGKPDRLGATLNALLENAQWCSSDPLCSEHDPHLTGRLNGAACHACALVSETSCEYGNRMLDRALIRDLTSIDATGFFNDVI